MVTSITSPSFCLHSAFTEVQEPYAVVVLLEKDLIVVDLTQSKYVTVKHTVRHHISESHHRVCKNITQRVELFLHSAKQSESSCSSERYQHIMLYDHKHMWTILIWGLLWINCIDLSESCSQQLSVLKGNSSVLLLWFQRSDKILCKNCQRCYPLNKHSSMFCG